MKQATTTRPRKTTTITTASTTRSPRNRSRKGSPEAAIVDLYALFDELATLGLEQYATRLGRTIETLLPHHNLEMHEVAAAADNVPYQVIKPGASQWAP